MGEHFDIGHSVREALALAGQIDADGALSPEERAALLRKLEALLDGCRDQLLLPLGRAIYEARCTGLSWEEAALEAGIALSQREAMRLAREYCDKSGALWLLWSDPDAGTPGSGIDRRRGAEAFARGEPLDETPTRCRYEQQFRIGWHVARRAAQAQKLDMGH